MQQPRRNLAHNLGRVFYDVSLNFERPGALQQSSKPSLLDAEIFHQVLDRNHVPGSGLLAPGIVTCGWVLNGKSHLRRPVMATNTATTFKQQAHALIDQLPDTATWNDTTEEAQEHIAQDNSLTA